MALFGYCLSDGGIKGSNKKQGCPKDSILMYGFKLDVKTPFDEAGHHHITGNRVWSICYADLAVDPGTNLLYQACIDKDNKDKSKPFKVEFGFFRVAQDNIGVLGLGESAPYYKINIEDARVVSCEFNMDGIADGGKRSEYVRVGWIYSKIMGTFNPGGIGFSDSWAGGK